MGKVLLYHPISLHVIRGAAEFCGWQFGKITQVAADRQAQFATYLCEVKLAPFPLEDQSPRVALKILQACFMDDIKARHLRATGRGRWLVFLDVDLKKSVAEYDLDEVSNVKN